ncbi:hypothetical protein DFH06DRAFT_1125521 [Mycena polygramma]|nr:hypothetical protein DFH06DRAFT_1125521 [Mycena polygramma]
MDENEQLLLKPEPLPVRGPIRALQSARLHHFRPLVERSHECHPRGLEVLWILVCAMALEVFHQVERTRATLAKVFGQWSVVVDIPQAPSIVEGGAIVPPLLFTLQHSRSSSREQGRELRVPGNTTHIVSRSKAPSSQAPKTTSIETVIEIWQERLSNPQAAKQTRRIPPLWYWLELDPHGSRVSNPQFHAGHIELIQDRPATVESMTS